MLDDATVAELERIGTFGYKGLASFWNLEYERYLRDLEPEALVLVHNALIEAGLDITGASLAHEGVILRAIHRDVPVTLRQRHG
jgi:hypothetical protein